VREIKDPEEGEAREDLIEVAMKTTWEIDSGE
jgi:hypothetical protein